MLSYTRTRTHPRSRLMNVAVALGIHALVLLLLLLLYERSTVAVVAFGSGYHYDLTRNGMELRQFSRTSDAIPIVQVCNTITDFDAFLAGIDMPNYYNKYRQLFNTLHFSNLYNSKMVSDYWIQFVMNQKATVEAIVNGTVQQNTETAGDPATEPIDPKFMLLCSLGFTLHATQDFYAHSNFIDTLRNTDNDRCYFAANVYNFSYLAGQQYNQHSFVSPTRFKSQIKSQYPDADIVEHGGYWSGINKDSASKAPWDAAYASAFMGTIDTIDTWHGWVNNETFWSELLTYNITDSTVQGQLTKGLLNIFQIANYAKIAFYTDHLDGRWKGPGSGRIAQEAGQIVSFLRSDWQRTSPFQRTFYDTRIGQILTNRLDGQAGDIPKSSGLLIPNPLPETVNSFNPQRIGLVFNNPSQYKAIAVRTWGAGQWKTVPKSQNDQQIDGLYAVVGIAGQEFREATQYQSWIQPFWTAIRFEPVSTERVNITYDLMIFASAVDVDWSNPLEDFSKLELSDVFSKDQDIEANIKPPASATSDVAKMATQPTNVRLVQAGPQYNGESTHTRTRQHTMRVRPVHDDAYGVSEPRKHESWSSSFNELVIRVVHRMKTFQASAELTKYTYRDEINPDVLHRETKGVVFTYDTSSQKIVEGLPSYYLDRTYLDVNHSLRLRGADGSNLAQVNLTITTLRMCETVERQRAGEGIAQPALVAEPITEANTNTTTTTTTTTTPGSTTTQPTPTPTTVPTSPVNITGTAARAFFTANSLLSVLIGITVMLLCMA